MEKKDKRAIKTLNVPIYKKGAVFYKAALLKLVILKSVYNILSFIFNFLI